jgi:hypothetical protein
VGGLLLLSFLGVVLFGIMARRPVLADPRLVLYLRNLEERDRELWQAIAHLDRRSLPGTGAAKEVIIVRDKAK